MIINIVCNSIMTVSNLYIYISVKVLIVPKKTYRDYYHIFDNNNIHFLLFLPLNLEHSVFFVSKYIHLANHLLISG